MIFKKKYTVDTYEHGRKISGNSRKFSQDDLLSANIGHIAACIDSIANTVSENNFVVYDPKKEEFLPDHRFSQRLQNPNEFDSEAIFTYEYVSSLLWSGNAYIFKQPDGEYNILPSQKVTIKPSASEYIKGFEVQQTQKKFYSPDQIVFLRRPQPDKTFLSGRSLIETMAFQSDIYQYQMDSETQLNKNDSSPPFYIKTAKELTNDQAKDTQLSWWQNFRRGSKGFKKPPVMHSGTELVPLKWSPVEVQFLESKRYNREEIFLLAGVPTILRGADANFNRATADAVYYQYLRETIKPLLTLLAQQWTLEFKKQFAGDYKRGLRIGFNKEKLALQDRQQDHFELVDSLDRGMISPEYYQQRHNYPEYTPKEPKEPTKIVSIEPVTKNLDASGQRYRDQVDNKKKRIENQYKSRLQQIFKKIENKVIDHLENQRKDLSDDLDFDLTDEANEAFKASSEFISTSHRTGYQHMLRFHNIDGTYPVGSNELARLIRNRESLLKNSVNDTLYNEIKTQITQSTQGGESFEDLVKRLRNIGVNNAERIAVTEVTQAFNEGVLNAGIDSNYKKKQWITMNDARVRDLHILAQNEGAIGINETFSSVGLKKPEEPNCRCTIMMVEG